VSMRSWRGPVVGGIGVILALVALTPREWADRLAAWRFPLSILAALLLGVSVWSWFYRTIRDDHALIIDGERYAAIYQELVTSGRFKVIKVFGYTGETVMSDLMRFKHRYESSLEFRFLHRSWIAEARDEQSHNESPMGQGRRRWSKSGAIQSFGIAEWNFPSRRDVRYYGHHPILKGVLFCNDADTAPAKAILTFQYWVPSPPEGGSVFKGADQYAIYLHQRSNATRALLHYLNTQFDYEWYYGKTADDLLRQSGDNLEVVDERTESG
jgi:hypothetical protein